MDNVISTKDYFNRRFQRLRRIRDTKQTAIAEATACILEQRLKGVVLDIGSGNRGDYGIDRVDLLVAGDISTQEMMSFRSGRKVKQVLLDGRFLPCKDSTFDCVAILHLLHHLAGASLKQTNDNIYACLTESFRVLKRGGAVFIIDAFCASSVQRIEDFVFPVLRAVFATFGRPMAHYFSLMELHRIIADVGFTTVRCERLATGDALLCPFDSAIGVPFKFTPIRHLFVEARKP